MGNVEKLPKWAQDRIGVLESRVEDAERKVATVLGQGEFKSNAYVKNRYGVDDTPLPQWSRVEFVLDDGPECRAQVYLRGGRLVITGIGSGGLDIRPEVSNVVTIGFTQ